MRAPYPHAPRPRERNADWCWRLPCDACDLRLAVREEQARGVEVQGDEPIAPIRWLQPLRPMIRWHPESLDGHGYPDGLCGADVPMEAWIVKTADYWEAITSRRPYRAPMALELAVRTLRGEGGVRIPKEVVETFLEAIVDAPIALPAAV